VIIPGDKYGAFYVCGSAKEKLAWNVVFPSMEWHNYEKVASEENHKTWQGVKISVSGGHGRKSGRKNVHITVVARRLC
jgi:hypothetical protein